MSFRKLTDRAGAHDRILMYRDRFVLVELKTKVGKLRPKQVVEHALAHERGHPSVVVRTFNEFSWVVAELLV